MIVFDLQCETGCPTFETWFRSTADFDEQRAGGRVFQPDPERLGEYVVADYLRTRRGRRAH